MCTSTCTKVLLKSLVAIVGTSTFLTHNVFHVNAADAKPYCELEKTSKWNFKWDYQKRPTAGSEPCPPKAKRNILLIRHGKYHQESGHLQDSGVLQAKLTGQKLKTMKLPYKRVMISSTMRRAIDTVIKIKNENSLLDFELEQDLSEGLPISPEPPAPALSSLTPQQKVQVDKDGTRIERAFKTYFYRAFPSETDTYEIIVCHANVIRYLICRALQLPPEAWMRFTVNHGSITWIVIHPDGRVQLKCSGDSAYMPTKLQTEC